MQALAADDLPTPTSPVSTVTGPSTSRTFGQRADETVLRQLAGQVACHAQRLPALRATGARLAQSPVEDLLAARAGPGDAGSCCSTRACCSRLTWRRCSMV